MNLFSTQKNLLCTALCASLLAGLSGCQDEDFGYTAEQIAYQSNFEKKFGKIADDQIWDFSSYNLQKLGLTGGPSNDAAAIGGSITRAYDATEAQVNAMRDVVQIWWDVPSKTINWLNRNMMERYDHRTEGSAFKLINPYYDENNSNENRDFLIIPIYQGSSGMTWDLHLVDDNNDYTIWKKSKDIEYKVDYTQYEEFFYDGSETNSVWNADPEKAIPATNIKLGKAFPSNIEAEYGWVMCFELPTYNEKMPGSANGAFTGVFYAYTEDSSGKITHRAKLTDIGTNGQVTFDQKGRDASGALTRDNSVIFDDVFNAQGPKGSASDGYAAEDDSNIKIKLADDFSNLLLETNNNRTNCSFDPYDPQRIKIFTHSEKNLTDCPWLKDNNYTPLQDFDTDQNGNTVSVSFFKGHTINRNNVHTKVMKIDTKKIGPEFSLYLQTTYSDDNNANYAKEGTKHRSNGTPSMMLALQDFTKDSEGSPLTPAEVKAIFSSVGLAEPTTDCEYMVIGCEDANGSASDWDYNDVVFLVVGYPKAPKIAKNVISKRYMIEDLGSTFDFDFNDIVVDVTQEDILDIAINKYSRKQIASIAHLCGTIPFEVFIGGQSMGKLMGQNNNNSEFGYDPKSVGAEEYKRLYVKTYNGKDSWSASSSAPANSSNGLPWEPDQNNITVAVWPQAASVESAMGSGSNSSQNSVNQLDIKDAQQIEFPSIGKFPYIIAVDQDINWMTELSSVPRSWFHTEQNLTDYDKDHPHEHPTVIDETLTDDQCKGLGLGYLVPTSEITNTTGQVNGQTIGITTIDLGSTFTDNKYRQGDITISIVVDKNCPDYTEVKGDFVQTSGVALPDSYYDFEDFETYNGWNSIAVKKKTIKLTSKKVMEAAAKGELKFNVSYATFGFGSEWKPRARMLVNWDPAVPIGIISTDWSPNGEGDHYGTELNYTYTSESTDSNRQMITVGTAFDDSYTSDQNAYITFVLPSGYKLSGNFYAFDDKGFFYSNGVDLEGSRAYTIKLNEEYRKMLAGEYGNQKANFRFVVNSATKNGDAVQVDKNDVQVYVDWDANYLSLNTAAEENITVNLYGSDKVVTMKSASSGTITASGYDTNKIDVTVSDKDLTIKPKAVGTTTITVYQEACSSSAVDKYKKASNRVKINVTVTDVCYSVGIHHQVKLYGQSNYVETQSELNKIGNLTCTTTGTFYTKNGSNYDAVDSKTVNLLNGELYYVVPNTSVTFTLPSNADYKLDEANSFSNGTRDATIDHDGYTPYVKWSEKADPELALTDPSQATIVLDYAKPYVDIEWSKASGSGDVKFKGYNYETEVNIWRNGEQNSHHMRAQEKNFNNKKITMYVDATDTHRSASIELDVTVRDYVDNNYGYRVPATGNEVLARMIKDALHNTTKNIQIMVRRGTSVPATIKVKNATGEWDKTLKENDTWTSEVASHNDTWEGQDAVSFTFTISASDFSTYFKEWDSKLVFYGFDDWNGINDGGENQRGVWVKAVD